MSTAEGTVIFAARALRHYPRQDVLAALLACLDDPDFAVRYHAAESLTALTGVEAGTDADGWRAALAEKDDPFSHPEPRRRPWWNMLGVFPER